MIPEPPTPGTENRGARRATTLVRGDATGGRLAVVELHEVRGHEPPRHLHADEDELVYVLEGELTVCVGEEVHRAPAGTCLFLPRGTDHGYAVESATARLLVVLAPAGPEGFVGEATASADADGVERLIATAARYGVAITGPAPLVTPRRRARAGGPAFVARRRSPQLPSRGNTSRNGCRPATSGRDQTHEGPARRGGPARSH